MNCIEIYCLYLFVSKVETIVEGGRLRYIGLGLSYVCRLVGIGCLEDYMSGNNTNRAEDIENEYLVLGNCIVLA